MNLTKHNLINLPVYTQSKQHLGKVCDFEVDPSTHVVVKYHVKSGGLIKELLREELIVGKDQVISLSPEKMVVDDNLIAQEETKKEPVRGTIPAA